MVLILTRCWIYYHFIAVELVFFCFSQFSQARQVGWDHSISPPPVFSSFPVCYFLFKPLNSKWNCWKRVSVKKTGWHGPQKGRHRLLRIGSQTIIVILINIIRFNDAPLFPYFFLYCFRLSACYVSPFFSVCLCLSRRFYVSQSHFVVIALPISSIRSNNRFESLLKAIEGRTDCVL